MAEDLGPIFAALRQRFLEAARGMDAASDTPGNLVLKAPWSEPGKKEGAWFAAVRTKKNYVSCHLMPLYALPALREQVPAPLEKRMQGKSCFNFKKAEPELFDLLEQLVARCAEAYAQPVAPQPHQAA